MSEFKKGDIVKIINIDPETWYSVGLSDTMVNQGYILGALLILKSDVETNSFGLPFIKTSSLTDSANIIWCVPIDAIEKCNIDFSNIYKNNAVKYTSIFQRDVLLSLDPENENFGLISRPEPGENGQCFLPINKTWSSVEHIQRYSNQYRLFSFMEFMNIVTNSGEHRVLDTRVTFSDGDLFTLKSKPYEQIYLLKSIGRNNITAIKLIDKSIQNYKIDTEWVFIQNEEILIVNDLELCTKIKLYEE